MCRGVLLDAAKEKGRLEPRRLFNDAASLNKNCAANGPNNRRSRRLRRRLNDAVSRYQNFKRSNAFSSEFFFFSGLVGAAEGDAGAVASVMRRRDSRSGESSGICSRSARGQYPSRSWRRSRVRSCATRRSATAHEQKNAVDSRYSPVARALSSVSAKVKNSAYSANGATNPVCPKNKRTVISHPIFC